MSQELVIMSKDVTDAGVGSIWPVDGSEKVVYVPPVSATLVGAWLKNGPVAITATNVVANLVSFVLHDNAPDGTEYAHARLDFKTIGGGGPGPIAAWELLDLVPWLTFNHGGPFTIPFLIPSGGALTFQQGAGVGAQAMGTYQIVFDVRF